MKYLIGLVLLLTVGLGAYFFLKPTQTLPPQPALVPSPTSLPIFPTDTIAPTVLPTKKVNLVSPSNSGPATGKISCDYQVPATPNSQGDAKLMVTGQNLTSSSVCVSINGASPNLMSDLSTQNSAIIDAPWISLTANYNFDLFSQPNCGGTLLSSCRINTNR